MWGCNDADHIQSPCPCAVDAVATFPGKEREKPLNCMQLFAPGLGTPGPGSRVECPPTAISCTTLGPSEILTPLPASVWVQHSANWVCFGFLLSGFLLGGELNRCATTLVAPRQTGCFVVAVVSLSSFKELPPVAL